MGVKNWKKLTPPLFRESKFMNRLGLLGFLVEKIVLGSQLHRICVDWCGMSAHAVFSRFCYVSVFGNLTIVWPLRTKIGRVGTTHKVPRRRGWAAMPRVTTMN